MDKELTLAKLDKFCPSWIDRPDWSLSIAEIMQHVISQVLPGLLDVKVEYIGADKITGSAPYKRETANVMGYMHGGTLFTLGDTLAGAFLWANSDETHYAVTTGCEIKYLKPVIRGTVKCTVVEQSRNDRKVTLAATF